MNGPLGWCPMLRHNFLVWKLTSAPPGPAAHPWPQIDAELCSVPLAPVCFCLNSNAGTRPSRDQLSLSEQLLISRIGLSRVTIVCDVQNSYFHSISPSCLACSSQSLAVTDTSPLQDEWQLWVHTQDSTWQSEFILRTVRSSPNSIGWIWNYYPTVSNVKLCQ